MAMKDEKILEVIDRYNQRLWGYRPRRNGGWPHHLRWMLIEMRTLLKEGRREKLMRWLGFVQGVLWSKGIYTLDELKNHSRPSEGPAAASP